MPYYNRMKKGDMCGVLTQTHMLSRCLNCFLLTNCQAPMGVGDSVYICAALVQDPPPAAAGAKHQQEPPHKSKRGVTVFAVCDNGAPPSIRNDDPSRHSDWVKATQAFHYRSAKKLDKTFTIVGRRCIGRVIHPPEYLKNSYDFNELAWNYWTKSAEYTDTKNTKGKAAHKPDDQVSVRLVQEAYVSKLKHVSIDLRA